MKKTGFTLLELIIVIIVIGILAAMALPQFIKVAERGRIAKAKGILDTFRKAEGIYYAYESQYSDNAGGGLEKEVPEIATVANDNDWKFDIESTDNFATKFTVTATRKSGAYEGNTIIINQLGQFYGSHTLEFPPGGPGHIP